MLKSDFLHIAKERGFLHQCTDEEGLAKLLKSGPVTAYIGFDCTAPSLHVGSLMQIMILRLFQQCGHKPIILLGGATTRIGDPSGKTAERPPLSDEQITVNLAGIRGIFDRFLTFGGQSANAVFVNNADWMDKLGYLGLLRDYGRHFSINRMLSMDSVKLRLEREDSEMNFLEFNYMIMQAYDFVKLHETHGCNLQIGGSDQWGNIISGVELHRRLMAKKNTGKINVYEPIFGLTTPLITTASGAKMGKTESGAVWLNADMLSSFDYWQFWRNTEDGDVGRFLRFFTALPMSEIRKLEALGGAEINEAKKVLANEATKLCHGVEAATNAAETARKTFEEGGAGDNLKTVQVEKAELEADMNLVDLLHIAGLSESKGAARKLIEGGGARMNDEKISDVKAKVGTVNLTADGYIKLSSGKKHHVLVKVKT